ncbi:MAG: single-stranded DNA-binding protein [Firmicutes bacterium]|nr:single-stranded DNA-binding protein [Bacillota bacterium]
MNSVVLIGNLARDPELRYSTGANGTAICRFTIAVNDGFGERKRTDFIPIVVFGKTAETCDRFLKKGSKVCVNGRIQTGSYEKEGRTIYTTDVIANNYGGVEFLTPQGGGVQDPGPWDKPTPQPPVDTPEPEPTGTGDVPDGFSSMQDDDLPF